jgi:WD40 repeat protein
VTACGRAGCLDNIIQSRDGTMGRPLGPAVGTPPVSGLVFTSEAKMLAGGGFDGSVRLCDVQTLQSLGVVAGSERSVVRHLAASADGKVAAAYDNGIVAIWDVDVEAWKQQARRIANRELSPAERQKFLGLEASGPTK